MTHIDRKDYVSAEEPTKISLQIAQELNYADAEANMHEYLALIQFFHFLDYQKAIEHAEHHLQYEKSIGRYYYVIPTAQLLMKIHTAAGQLESALEYADVAILYQDSLYWANRKNDAADIEKAYELEQKYKEVERLENQRRIRTILGIGGMLFLLLLAGFFYYQRQLKNKHIKTQEQFSQELQRDKSIIEKQNEQLANLNATKDRLFAIIGHDLRGPLYSLQGLEEQINYLLETGQLNRLKELSEGMEETTKYISSTLNNLLNWSIQQMGAFPYNPEKVNLRNVVQEILSLFENNIKNKEIDVNLKINTSTSVFMDNNALHIILRNVLSNAIKFSDTKDKIFIEVHQEHKAVILSIKDEGTGMHQEQVLKIKIGIISKGKEGTQGEKSIGLGWNLIKELVPQNKGTFDIRSTLGKGTIVKLIFPMA